MSALSRFIVATTVGVVLAGSASCGVGVTPSPSSQQAGSGLANLDLCKVMTPQQLGAAGLPTQGELVSQIPTEPGCSFDGNKLLLTFYKNQTETIDSYQKDGNWAQYTKTTVNGRTAAQAITAGSQTAGVCNTLMNAGGGVVIVTVTAPETPENQVCDESAKYAQEVEPNLPK